MNISSHWEEPHIMIIDSNRLFRDKLVFVFKNEAKSPSRFISSYCTLSAIPSPFSDPIDLLLIEGSQLLEIEEMSLLSKIYTQFPNIKIFLMSERVNTSVPNVLMSHHGLEYQIISKKIQISDLLNTLYQTLSPEEEITPAHLNGERIDLLTPREIEILNYVVNGQSNKEIARSLIISESTVKVHVQNILKKFDVSSRVEAAVYAVRHAML